MSEDFFVGDCLEILPQLAPQSVDLVFGSPPYEDARTYGIGFNLKGQAWVDWMVRVCKESLRVCRGLAAFVVQGRTKDFRWSCTPALLIADLHKADICVRNPPLYNRSGIPGSGGPDWLRSDYEWIVCITNGGRLPWSDNTAMGNGPKFGPGGNPTNRKKDGKRVQLKFIRPADKSARSDNFVETANGVIETQDYKPPERANPGNVIYCSGGHLGSPLAHENEAPFPEKLAEFMIRSFCPSNGIVLDPFSGSGTVAAVAKKTGRNSISIDIRENQIDLTLRRLEEIDNERSVESRQG
jgi:hypothetical protein